MSKTYKDIEEGGRKWGGVGEVERETGKLLDK